MYSMIDKRNFKTYFITADLNYVNPIIKEKKTELISKAHVSHDTKQRYIKNNCISTMFSYT